MASSSAGNATYIASGRTRLLVDAGLSRREIAKRLAAIGEDVDDLDAILVTHEHCDHVAGLAALARKACKPFPVYVTDGTANGLDWEGGEQPPLEIFGAGRSFTIGDFDIASFTIPHDASIQSAILYPAAASKLPLLPISVTSPIHCVFTCAEQTSSFSNRITILKCCAWDLTPGR